MLLIAVCFFRVQASVAFLLAPAGSLPAQQQQQQQQANKGFTLFAKKKKGGQQQQQQQQKSGFEWASSFILKPFEAKATRELAMTACASYEGRKGAPLSPEIKISTDIPKSLWNSPIACCIVAAPSSITSTTSSSDNENGEEAPPPPKLAVIYANAAALETVGLRPDQFDQFMASTDNMGNIVKIPENAIPIDLPWEFKGDGNKKKYESGYKKKILRGQDGGGASGSGAEKQDIAIVNAQRWSMERSILVDGKFKTETLGLAYAWSEWLQGEKIICRAGGIRKEAVDIGLLEEKIQAQGAAIRELKQVQGFGNKDPKVVEAVEELLRLKAQLLEETEPAS
jgi:hypothetical protein